MARLGCYCGNTLSNVECPSKDIIRVFYKERIENLLKEDRELELWDIYSEPEDFDFWHCDQCGRVYACPIPGQSVKYVCNPIEVDESVFFNKGDCTELFIFDDTLLDSTIEESFHMLWEDFYKKNTQKRFFLNIAQKKVWIIDKIDDSIVGVYAIEEVPHVDANPEE